MKKIAALLLALLMCVALPMAALAAEEETAPTVSKIEGEDVIIRAPVLGSEELEGDSSEVITAPTLYTQIEGDSSEIITAPVLQEETEPGLPVGAVVAIVVVAVAVVAVVVVLVLRKKK